MKLVKYILTCISITVASNALFAQNMYDALRYSEQYSQGTARSMAMGNAFVALGGDLGGISINPASSGVFKYNEASISASVSNINSNNSYLGNSISANNTTGNLANVGIVGTFNTGRRNSGLISWNLGLVFNRYQTFYRTDNIYGTTAESSFLASLAQNTNGINAISMDLYDGYDPFFSSSASWKSTLAWNSSLLDTLSGTNDSYIAATENLHGNQISMGGELDQKFHRNTRGSMSEIMVNIGGNFSNKLFFGINIGIHSVLFRTTEIYSESAVNSSSFQTGFEHFEYGYAQKTSGTGFNVKAGIIYLPTKSLRLGASISTPTWLFLHDKWAEDIYSRFDDGYDQYIDSPLGEYDYKINTPLRWNVGAAYTFGTKGVLSIDYEQVNYGKAEIKEDNNLMSDNFAYENSQIKENYKLSHIIRVGAEANVTQGVSLRGGYQFYSNPYGTEYEPNHIFSLGLGYCSNNGYFIDVAYQQKIKSQETEFTLYDDVYDGNNVVYKAPVGVNTNKYFNILLTLGVRF